MKTQLPPADFDQLGFMCGLEIHQQLDTKRKLFCRCPVGLRHEPPDATILRHMRPTLSELGEYDGTALMEFKTRKNVIYQLVKGSTCTYEMDDTPPFELNQQALDIALEISLLLNCNIVDEIHISRKQYLDGSIPTGFQRTVVVGVEGWVPYKDRRIRIIQICLEEDACREISDIGHTITFKADRLSTPLVEVITYPDMKSPIEAAEVNELIGRLLKASGKVRRGIGSVRQDVNVSINGGTRVEIKGVAKTGYVRDLTHVEALRQKALLDIKAAIQSRGISRRSLVLSNHDLTDLLSGTKSASIRSALDSGGVLKCAKINGFAGLLNHPTQPGYTLAWEYSGRLKVVACIDQRPNLFHSDAPDQSELSTDEWTAIRNHCGCKLTDTVIVVWGSAQDVETALEEIKFRTLEAIRGVPNETRQDIGNGNTDFERILPGPDRMYPDTDLPPLAVTDERLKKIADNLQERSYEKEQRWRKLGLSEDVVRPLTISDRARVFDSIVADTDVNPKLVAVVLTQTLKSLRRKGLPTERVTDNNLVELFSMYSKGMFTREAIPDLLTEFCQSNNPATLAQIVEKHDYSPMRPNELEITIREEIGNAPSSSFKEDRSRTEYLMGRLMSVHRGRLPGSELRSRLAAVLEI
ncbi:MAG: Glu-tRNA(Gln) amidotransferase subunit GatE [Candidatus Zixiibacteriota bacterium]